MALIYRLVTNCKRTTATAFNSHKGMYTATGLLPCTSKGKEDKEWPGLVAKCNWPNRVLARGASCKSAEKTGCLRFWPSPASPAPVPIHPVPEDPGQGSIFATCSDIPCSQHAALSTTPHPSNPRSQPAALPGLGGVSHAPNLPAGGVRPRPAEVVCRFQRSCKEALVFRGLQLTHNEFL